MHLRSRRADAAFNTMLAASTAWTRSDSNPDLRFESPVVRRPWDVDTTFLRNGVEIDSSPVVHKARASVYERLLDRTVYPSFRDQFGVALQADETSQFLADDVTTRVHVVFVPTAGMS